MKFISHLSDRFLGRRVFKVMKASCFLVPCLVFCGLQQTLAGDPVPGPLHLESAVLVGHEDTINIYHAPTSGPNAKSFNIEIHLALSPDGVVSLASGKATATPLLPDNFDQFVAGEYVCVTDGEHESLTVEGPFNSAGGRHVWKFLTRGAHNFFAFGGTWTTGPAQGHPQVSKLDAQVAFPKEYSIGQNTNGDLVVVRQLGDKLILAPVSLNIDQATHVKTYIIPFYNIYQPIPPSN